MKKQKSGIRVPPKCIGARKDQEGVTISVGSVVESSGVGWIIQT
jgi:hypothetical protein